MEELVPIWGVLSTPASQMRPHSGLTRGSVCLSCRPFSLNDLDDYEKHFTVMNYDPEVVLKQVGGLEGPGEQVHTDPDPIPLSLSSGQAV